MSDADVDDRTSMNQLVVALDVDTGKEARDLANRLRDLVGGFKIGSHLFTNEGPRLAEELVARGDRLFLDLKFHDIPHTVARAAAAAARLGVWMIDVHASGGSSMMRAAKAAALEEAERQQHRAPLVIAVTVLTSLDQAVLREIGLTGDPASEVERLAALAESAGLDGVVASPLEIAGIRRRCSPEFVIVTPGIRGKPRAQDSIATGPERRAGPRGGIHRGVGAPGVTNDDQRRAMSAAEALAAGANYVVIGRPIIEAPDPRAAAEQIIGECRSRAVS